MNRSAFLYFHYPNILFYCLLFLQLINFILKLADDIL